MAEYVVIDVETTGLLPEMNDRIVELGVVLVSARGEIEGEWSTLINPQRDVGPTQLHGITATDVVSAPTFAEVAPDLLRAVAGRLVVAHNATFDVRFLRHELARAGLPLPSEPPALCTMQWSASYLETDSRRLADCCRACGVVLGKAHSAAADAMAAAGLLSHFLRTCRFEPPWRELVESARSYPWPPATDPRSTVRRIARSEVRARRPDEWLDRIIARMPRAALPVVDAYLAVLEKAMLDNFLAEHEKSALVETALGVGLTRGQVLDVHGSYLSRMAEVALEDRSVTSEEQARLEHAAAMLGLRPSDVVAALAQAQQRGSEGAPATTIASAGITLVPGDRVVFTGDMVRSRDEWERRARAAGLEPGGVTKTTKLVVAADPNSLSGKAAKARTYGIPIVTENTFERMLERLERG